MNCKLKQSGQVLLIIVMLLATALTVILAVTFRSTTETQITKLEEENQKALAAAEAGIEKALQQDAGGSFFALGLSELSGIDLTKSSVSFAATTTNTFISPLLQKDEQYTFYLINYDPSIKTFSGSYANGNLTIYFGQGNCPTLELSILNSAGTSLKRKLAKPACDTATAGSDLTVSSGSFGINGVSFGYQAQILNADLSGQALLIVRVLSAMTGSLNTKVAFQASVGNLFLQGSNITSTANSIAGVQKIVQLFQSYPQIPADFFVTSF